MDANDLRICRLCFASDNLAMEPVFSRIDGHLPFLSEITRISEPVEGPQTICSNCEFHIETAVLLRKRIQFTEIIWAKYKDRGQLLDADEKPFLMDSELILNCHSCGDNFDYPGLQSHIRSVHGKDHLRECEFCSVILKNSSVIIPIEVVSVAEDPVEYDHPGENIVPSPLNDVNDHEDWVDEISPIAPSSAQPEHLSDKTTSNRNKKEKPNLVCPICGRKSSRAPNLRRHMKTLHKSEWIASQKTVSKVQLTDDEQLEKLVDSMKSKNPGEPFVCPYCGKETNRSYNIRRHIKLRHMDRYVQHKPLKDPPEVDQSDSGGPIEDIRRDATESKIEPLDLPTMTPEIKKGNESVGTTRRSPVFSKTNVGFSTHRNSKKILECHICGKKSSRPDNLRRHLYTSHNIGHYSCVTRKTARRVSQYAGLIPCKVCGMKYSSMTGLKRHMPTHDGFLCKRCLLLFATEKEADAHQGEFTINFGVKGFEAYSCDKCPKKFMSHCEKETHEWTHVPHLCKMCGQSFESRRDLQQHDIDQHTDGSMHPCQECGLELETKYALKRHRLSQHTGGLCGTCGIWVPRGLPMHLKRHREKKVKDSFACLFNGCTKSFATKELLVIHRQTHSCVRSFVCDFGSCRVAFMTQRALLAHRIRHNPEKRYKCHFENCDRAFHQAFDLNLHIRRHTGEKPYECSGCGEAFYTMSLLRSHQHGCAMKGQMEESGKEGLQGLVKE